MIGLHAAALDYHDSPGPGSSARLEISALRLAAAFLEQSGEAGSANAVLLLLERVDELTGPPLPAMRELPPLPPGYSVRRVFGENADGFELPAFTRPFFGRRIR